MNNQIDYSLLESVMNKLPSSQLTHTRSIALKYLKENHLPSTKNEQWKYTNLNKAYNLFEESLRSKNISSDSLDDDQEILNAIEAHWIVINNDNLVTKNHDIEGLTITSLSKILIPPIYL